MPLRCKQPTIMKSDDMFILNDTAKKDPAVQIAMQKYKQQLQAEQQRRDRIRAGIEPVSQDYGVWNISDRH